MTNTKTLISIWAVYTCGDDRHEGPPTHFFQEERTAKAFAEGNGWYGGKASVRQHFAIAVGDKCYLIDREIDLDQKRKERRKHLRRTAIAKLTPEELEAIQEKDDD